MSTSVDITRWSTATWEAIRRPNASLNIGASVEESVFPGHAESEDRAEAEASAKAEGEESSSHDQDAFTGVVLTA